MPRLGCGRLLSLLGVFVLSLPVLPELRAQTAPAVSVRSVKFGQARLPSHRDPHFEIAVELRGERIGKVGESLEFHRTVELRLELAFAVGRGSHERFEFYRSEARLVGIFSREERTVYFFLPPEIVKRDRLSRDPMAWRVSISVEGEPIAYEPGSYSASLREPTAAQGFVARVEAEAHRNDGLLLPIYLTPFSADTSGRGLLSPSYLRSDAGSSAAEPTGTRSR